MKLMNINMEGGRHFDLVINFILAENPDCICFQEIPTAFLPRLQSLGYHPQFAPMMYDIFTAPGDTVGVAIAARTPLDTNIIYYAGSRKQVRNYDNTNKPGTTSFPIILATLNYNNETYHIATTHLPVTAHGKEDEYQITAVGDLLKATIKFPAHLLCGDMNMPRGYNSNYEKFITQYTDTIPKEYTSSLDASLHYAKNDPKCDQYIFDIYMVDYIFSQPPYQVSGVKLHFGISDHAGVTANVTKS